MIAKMQELTQLLGKNVRLVAREQTPVNHRVSYQVFSRLLRQPMIGAVEKRRHKRKKVLKMLIFLLSYP